MRALFFVLLLANHRRSRVTRGTRRARPTPTPPCSNQQMNADKIRVTAPRPMVLAGAPESHLPRMGYVRPRQT